MIKQMKTYLNRFQKIQFKCKAKGTNTIKIQKQIQEKANSQIRGYIQ